MALVTSHHPLVPQYAVAVITKLTARAIAINSGHNELDFARV